MWGWGGGGTPYNGLYREVLPEGGTLFRLEVYKKVEISSILRVSEVKSVVKVTL